MASHIKRGETLFIPFRDGVSISDSQLKPRMYKTVQAFERSFPGYYKGTDGVELVEYAEVVHGRWIEDYDTFIQDNGYESEPIHTGFVCSVCGRHSFAIEPFCHCGARMDLEV